MTFLPVGIIIVTFGAAIAGLVYIIANYQQLVAPPIGPIRTWGDLPQQFDVRQLGRIEGALPNLKRVIIVAHRVEKPTDELSVAVEKNFREHVTYLFLISKSRAGAELYGYYNLFEALARIALGPGGDVKTVVDIRQLPHDWVEVPYVFYQMEGPSGRIMTVAVRGQQTKEGIADTYELVDNMTGRALAQAILEEAPTNIYTGPEEFVDDPKIIAFPSEAVKKLSRGERERA